MGDLWWRCMPWPWTFLYDWDEEGDVVEVDVLKMEKMGFTIISLEVALSFYETLVEMGMVARKISHKKVRVLGSSVSFSQERIESGVKRCSQGKVNLFPSLLSLCELWREQGHPISQLRCLGSHN